MINISIMSESRKLEGGKTIKRAQQYEHLNTTYLPRDRTINTVSYYNRRKRQLKQHSSKQVIINFTQRNADRKDLQNQFQSFLRSNKNIDPYLSNYIREVSVQPVLNDNTFTNFNKALYPLDEDDIAQVVQQKYFPLQNYYNYIYDLQTKKQIFRFANETQAKINEAIHLPAESPHKDLQNNDRSEFIEEEKIDKKIRGLHISKFDPRGSVIKRQPVTTIEQLVPVHRNYMEGGNGINRFSFTVNQKSRVELSKKY